MGAPRCPPGGGQAAGSGPSFPSGSPSVSWLPASSAAGGTDRAGGLDTEEPPCTSSPGQRRRGWGPREAGAPAGIQVRPSRHRGGFERLRSGKAWLAPTRGSLEETEGPRGELRGEEPGGLPGEGQVRARCQARGTRARCSTGRCQGSTQWCHLGRDRGPGCVRENCMHIKNQTVGATRRINTD